MGFLQSNFNLLVKNKPILNHANDLALAPLNVLSLVIDSFALRSVAAFAKTPFVKDVSVKFATLAGVKIAKNVVLSVAGGSVGWVAPRWPILRATSWRDELPSVLRRKQDSMRTIARHRLIKRIKFAQHGINFAIQLRNAGEH
jgi:hypothetical protein